MYFIEEPKVVMNTLSLVLQALKLDLFYWQATFKFM